MPVRKPKACPHRSRLGENVARLRLRLDLTQEQVAEKTGVSARYIQNVEAGDNFPSLPTLVKLKAALGCGWEDLFSGCERGSK
ncbi:MAG: helix-turn-helix transcriptional regulator [Verrucomicrobiota bacterium]